MVPVWKADRSLESLTAEMKPRVQAWLKECEKVGLKVLIVETRRSKARQLWLYSKGRVISPAMEQRYLGYDDPQIYSKPGEKQVTWTLASKHMYGKAIDFCFIDKNGKAVWSGDWDKAFDIAEKVGLLSLYRATGYDKPHLEFNPNFVDIPPVIQKQIKENEAILEQRMKTAWDALDEVNVVKKHLANLKCVEYKPYIIK